MQYNLRWILALAAAGCIVAPPITDTADTDPGQVVDTGETDTEDSETADTWLPVDTGDSETGDTAPLAYCHAFDPMDSSPWRRVYRVTEGARQGTETQDGLGQVNAPTNWPGQAAQAVGFGYTSSVTIAGSTRPVTTYLTDCQPGPNGIGDRAVEIGYHLPNTNNLEPIVVGAKTPRIYLPSKAEFGGFGYSEQQAMEFRVLAQQRFVDPFSCLPAQPPCVRETRYTFRTNNTVTSLGEETLSIQGLGQVTAQKLQYVIDQQVIKDANLNPFSIFGDIFGSLFSLGGLQSTGDNQYNAEITRWYVEGVGLVREQSVDITTKDVISTKELTACSGLPGC